MSLNLIDLIKGQLGPALVSQVASQLGESESGISKAISGLLPAVVGGLAHNAENPSVVSAITNAASSGILSDLLGNSTGNTVISGLLTSLFGDKLAGLVHSVANFAGIGNTSTNSVLNLVTGATLGSVGKYANDNHLDASGIKHLLDGQKGILSTLLPAGLSLASLGLDTENWFGKTKETVESVASTAKDNLAESAARAKEKIDVTRSEIKEDLNAHNDGGGSVWKWLLPILLLALAAWFLWKQCDKKKAEESAGTADSVTVTTDSTVVSDGTTTVTKVEQDIDLNGAKLKGYLGGMEDKMIAFLKGDHYKKASDDSTLKDVWYDFDHVNFKMGSSSQLEPGSETQLDNLVAILKAYPDVKIKIGGYTDKTGDEAVNKKISAERAKFIQKWLTEKGVGAQVVSAEGYGSEFAKVPATASDTERASDRKMAVRFTK